MLEYMRVRGGPSPRPSGRQSIPESMLSSGIPNSALLPNDVPADSGLDEGMHLRLQALLRQNPEAEAEADRLSRGVRATTVEGVKSEMSCRLGADLSDVRLHTDGAAAERADRLGANAFTVGRDVYFGSGGFHAGTAAHEMVHTVQQGAAEGGVSVSAPMGSVQMQPTWGNLKTLGETDIPDGGRREEINSHINQYNDLMHQLQSGGADGEQTLEAAHHELKFLMKTAHMMYENEDVPQGADKLGQDLMRQFFSIDHAREDSGEVDDVRERLALEQEPDFERSWSKAIANMYGQSKTFRTMMREVFKKRFAVEPAQRREITLRNSDAYNLRHPGQFENHRHCAIGEGNELIDEGSQSSENTDGGSEKKTYSQGEYPQKNCYKLNAGSNSMIKMPLTTVLHLEEAYSTDNLDMTDESKIAFGHELAHALHAIFGATLPSRPIYRLAPYKVRSDDPHGRANAEECATTGLPNYYDSGLTAAEFFSTYLRNSEEANRAEWLYGLNENALRSDMEMPERKTYEFGPYLKDQSDSPKNMERMNVYRKLNRFIIALHEYSNGNQQGAMPELNRPYIDARDNQNQEQREKQLSALDRCLIFYMHIMPNMSRFSPFRQ